MTYDFCIIGGGIVGVATAMEIARSHPGAGVLLLEKEDRLAHHQTGHNSGVIHAGIYYKPGSLKAELCSQGAEATKRFCVEHGVPFEVRGKLVVATNEVELGRLADLHGNAQKNGITLENLDAAELKRREPGISGLGALFSPATSIVDFRRVAEAMGEEFRRAGGQVEFTAKIDAIQENGNEVTVADSSRSWRARHLIVCAGLQSDRLARIAGLKIEHQIIPFRGEYYEVSSRKRDLVHHLIYPVPDPDLPFLGIHLTPMIDGSVTVGPNAVLGFSRENYKHLSLNVDDVLTFLRFPGFWRVVARHWRSGVSETLNSLFKERYLAECQKYCPSLTIADLLPREAGIRAQAVSNNGDLIHDFLFFKTARMLHVANAPSPAATAALPIAKMIVSHALGKFA